MAGFCPGFKGGGGGGGGGKKKNWQLVRNVFGNGRSCCTALPRIRQLKKKNKNNLNMIFLTEPFAGGGGETIQKEHATSSNISWFE